MAKKTKIRCFVCRRVFVEMALDTSKYFEEVYDFCPNCENLMMYDFERQGVGLPSLPLNKLKHPRLKLEGK